LDKLAESSVVFERMYSLASYTGKSVGPMLIGRYPNETMRDGGHFNTFFKENVFVAERLKAAGVRTLSAQAHWYFNVWSGLAQGFDLWDLTAKPGEGQGDNDTSTTSKELADACIRILGKKDNTLGRRFFFWAHFNDPHAQYVPHEGAPSFLGADKSPLAGARAAYDTEVWFTDKHLGRVLDFVAKQPWAEKTAIIVTADHGEAFLEHGMNNHGIELWEPLVRVPFVVHVPGLPARRVPVKRGHIDVAPTILELMKVEPPGAGELRGTSLVADVLEEEDDFAERDIYLDMPAGPYNAMRRGFIHGATPGMKLLYFGGTQYQLFDLAADPGEKDDLSQDNEKLAPVLDAFQKFRAGLQEIEVKPEDKPL
jgi:arylsulfatase A-like enzyme